MNTFRQSSLIFTTLLFFWLPGFAKDQPKDLNASHVLLSKFLEEERPFTVHLPPSYFQDPTANFMVLYVLDGQKRAKDTQTIVSYLQGRQQIPELIIVSIPHTGQRHRDYFPFSKESGAINPGIHHFSNFLIEELVPTIEENYRTKPHRAILGHSSAGVFVIHSLISHPHFFKTRLAFSPALHHCKGLVPKLTNFLKNKPKLNGFLYANIGMREFEPIRKEFTNLKNALKQYQPNNLNYQMQAFEFDGHATTPFIGTYSALKARFAPFRLTLSGFKELAQRQGVVAYYSDLSEDFGFDIKPTPNDLMSLWHYFYYRSGDQYTASHALSLIDHYHAAVIHPGNLAFMKAFDQAVRHNSFPKQLQQFAVRPNPESHFLNNLGYEHLRYNKPDKAIFLFQQNAEMHPGNANAHDSLGEAYERKGLLQKARSCYEKAVTIARNAADSDLAHYEAKLKRLTSLRTNRQ